MNKTDIGVGSVSIILVFTVLCLTIFAVLTYATANTDKTLADAAVQMAERYYAADTLAEQILAEIMEADNIPESIRGVDILNEWDWEEGIEHVVFSCPISDTRELYVDVAISFDSYDVLIWKIRNAGESVWETDKGLPVWEGF